MTSALSAPSTEAVLTFSEELTRIACSGGGMKALAAHLAQRLEAAVLVEDAEWRHLGLSGASGRTVPPSVRELINNSVPEGGGALRFQLPGGSQGMAFPIRAGESLLGRLSIFPETSFRSEDSAFARLTATTMAVELSREQGGSKNRRKSFWDRLLTRAYEDPIEARDDATSRGIVLAPGYVAVAIEAEGLDENSATSKHADLRRICLEALRGGSGEIVVVERGSGFVFLCPVALEIDAANARTAAGLIARAAGKSLTNAKLIGGIGRYADAVDAARTVEEAREAMYITRRLFGSGRVIAHDDLGIYPLLLRGSASREDWHGLSTRILEKLRSYDAKHQTELIRTLQLYFSVGQNVKTAAAELNVHRHTVFYRLRQIAEISGLNLDSPHDQLTLRAAMAVDALHA
jgi:sugar diacid utilization regulator